MTRDALADWVDEHGCPIAFLMTTLDAGVAPPLAFVVRWSDGDREPLQAMWRHGLDAMWMRAALRRIGHPAATPWRGWYPWQAPSWLRCAKANRGASGVDVFDDVPDDMLCRQEVDGFAYCTECCDAIRATVPTLPVTLAQLVAIARSA